MFNIIVFQMWKIAFEEDGGPTLNPYNQNPRESKSTWGEQPVEDILKFTCICVCVYLFIYLFVWVTPPDHTNNDTDLKFGTHTPIDLI